MEISAKQMEFIINSIARLNIAEGSVRSGKTFGTILRWIEFCKNGPSGPLLMAGKTERTLKRNILDPIEEMISSQVFRYSQGSGECFIGDRKIYVAGANDERAEQKIRGMTLAGIYGDEIALWPQSFFTMALSRLSVRGATFIGTTNPDGPYHWLKTNYLDRNGELNLKRFAFRIEDNPFLDPEYVGAIKKEYTGLWYKRFILGLWVQAEGAVYDMWDDSVHTADIPKKDFKHCIVGVDYGTSNPCAFHLVEWDTPDELSVTREYYFDSRKSGRQKTDGQYADDYIEWIGDKKPSFIYPDPSAASFIQELRRHHVPVRTASNDVIDGIRCVSAMLSSERLVVDRSCQNLIREFGSYVWDAKAQKRGEDKPVKENDHGLDALRYALFTHFGRSRIVTGGRLITANRR